MTVLACEPIVCVTLEPVIPSVLHCGPVTVSFNDGGFDHRSGAAEICGFEELTAAEIIFCLPGYLEISVSQGFDSFGFCVASFLSEQAENLRQTHFFFNKNC